MIDKKQIITMARHVFRKSKGIPDKRLMHPQREWAIGLLLFSVILVSGGLVTARSFVQYKDITIDYGDAGIRAPRYSQNVIQDVLNEYSQRETVFEAYISDTPQRLTPVSVPTVEFSSTTNIGIPEMVE